MNRIDHTFEQLKQQEQKALITFVTCGDPDLEMTEKLVIEMERSGADIIELGIPFSDPIAEGPVIQQASLRALKNGTTLVKIFEMVKRLRKQVQIPLLMMMYINTIFRFGTQRFFNLCKECGIDGVIVPDMPFEEQDEVQAYAEQAGVYSISLVAPTSQQRIQMIAQQSKGFLYCISSAKETGACQEFSTDSDVLFHTINQYSTIPTAIELDVSSSEQVQKIKQYCDGVIVGSAIVEKVAEYGKDAIAPVSELIRRLKAEL